MAGWRRRGPHDRAAGARLTNRPTLWRLRSWARAHLAQFLSRHRVVQPGQTAIVRRPSTLHMDGGGHEGLEDPTCGRGGCDGASARVACRAVGVVVVAVASVVAAVVRQVLVVHALWSEWPLLFVLLCCVQQQLTLFLVKNRSPAVLLASSPRSAV